MKSTKTVEMNQEIKDMFINMACQLEPENLSCDGELSRPQVQIKYNNIMKQWKALEKKIGREVDTYEPFNW